MPEPNVAGNTYDKYGSTNPIERRLMDGFLAAFDRMLDQVSADRDPAHVIEVGAGEGYITAHLRRRFPSAAVVGLDLLDDGLAGHWAAADAPDAPMLFGDATALPIASRSVDLVVALEVLEHVVRPERALAEIDRICGDDGAVIASVPREPIWRIGNLARGRYARRLGNTPGHVNHWSKRGFSRFVATTFAVDELGSPLPWTIARARPADR